jgi:hypothetical protein
MESKYSESYDVGGNKSYDGALAMIRSYVKTFVIGF